VVVVMVVKKVGQEEAGRGERKAEEKEVVAVEMEAKRNGRGGDGEDGYGLRTPARVRVSIEEELSSKFRVLIIPNRGDSIVIESQCEAI